MGNINVLLLDMSVDEDRIVYQELLSNSEYNVGNRKPLYKIISAREEWFPNENQGAVLIDDNSVIKGAVPGTMMVFLKFSTVGGEPNTNGVMERFSADELIKSKMKENENGRHRLEAVGSTTVTE